jgi:predicted unusual protein kinase regulating ubiquinone biosynthesis (AarF/ABC1/UbiB family)
MGRMLLRSISLISGVTSALNRDFNMWDAVDPFARTLLSGGGSSTVTAIGRQVLTALTTLSKLPQRLDSALTRLDQGLISMRVPELEKRVRRLDGSTRRLSAALLAGALFIGGILLRIAGDDLGNVLLISSIPLALHALGVFRLP